MEDVFRHPATWLLPDVVVGELIEPDGPSLVASAGHGKIEVVELPGDQVADVADLAQKYLRPSRVDLFALVLARWQGWPLITGDSLLRRAAQAEGVTCHGVLFVVDLLVDDGVILPATAALAIQAMIAEGSWLPAGPCRERIAKWGPKSRKRRPPSR